MPSFQIALDLCLEGLEVWCFLRTAIPFDRALGTSGRVGSKSGRERVTATARMALERMGAAGRHVVMLVLNVVAVPIEIIAEVLPNAVIVALLMSRNGQVIVDDERDGHGSVGAKDAIVAKGNGAKPERGHEELIDGVLDHSRMAISNDRMAGAVPREGVADGKGDTRGG